jgi:transcriptional regulator NrdR family protein
MAKGLICPACGGETRVLWTRGRPDGVQRQRVCIACGAKGATKEKWINRDAPAERIEKRIVASALGQVIVHCGLSAGDLFPDSQI